MITKLFEKSLATLKQRGSENSYDKGSFENGERSGAQIARVYNAIIGQNISEADAWTFLQCLKLVRMENQVRTGQGDLLDSAVDMLSYTALKAEAVLQHRPAQVAELVVDTTVIGVTSFDKAQDIARSQTMRNPAYWAVNYAGFPKP